MTYDAERLRELLLRLVGPEPKASHVSASETHEIADGCIELLDEVEKLRAGLSELESLRKWCKASIDADQVLCAENERLRNEPLRLQADALMRALAATQKELAELAALQEETRALNVRQCDELEEFRSYQPYTAALEECAQMRDELESLRKWCKASIDADQVLCAENERLRRFRDAVMAERDAALKVDGADAETEEAHDLLCDALDEVVDEERAALAKENG